MKSQPTNRAQEQLKNIFEYVKTEYVAFFADDDFAITSNFDKGIDFLDYNYSTVGYLALASFLCPILAFGLVPLFESFFGITTDLSLIELLDYDQPLLKMLM